MLRSIDKLRSEIQDPLMEALLKCKLMFKYALIFGGLVNLLMLATPIYSMQVLDRVISSANTDTLLALTMVIMLALMMLSLIQSARTVAMNKMGSWFEQELSQIMFKVVVRASLVSKGSGGSQQMRDLQAIKTFLTSPALISILDVPWALIFVAVLFAIHSYMGIMTVLGGMVLISIAILADRNTKHLHDSSNENFLKSMKTVDQTARNAEVVSVMGLFTQIYENWCVINHKVQDAQNLVSMRQNFYGEISKFIRMILQIFVTGLGAYLVLKNEMSVGAIIACSSISSRALAPFEQAISSWKQFLTTKQSYTRLQKTLSRFYTPSQRMSLPAPKGNIETSDLTYVPQGLTHPIINKISFRLNAGELLAIIGPSGSGKTTLAKLIVGAIEPTEGLVRIDAAGLKDWNSEELGQYIGYLPQSAELFGGTIRENIGRMNKEADASLVVEAAQLAGVHEMILQLPKGYDTEIGFDGSILSGGQKQRIGLARAFFGRPKIIVLDEPNANLDALGEAALNEALQQAKAAGITTIIISHRTQVLALADKIMIVKNGAVEMFGSTEEINAKLAQIAQGYQAQNSTSTNEVTNYSFKRQKKMQEDGQ
jgi:PrtD family type I secretion system ABC transporter